MMRADGHIAVVGCGLIGSGWAAWFLSRGLTVVCQDPAPDAEARVRQAVAASLLQIGCSEAEADDALSRFSFEADLDKAVSGASWIQENAPEDVQLKRELIARIDRIAGPEVIIASSTSSIRMSDLQAGMSYPGRLVAGHPFLPVSLIPLVEVVGGAATSAAAVDAAMAFYKEIGKRPIRLNREIAGHVANRLQAAVLREAFFLLQEGVASAPDIDLALTEGPGPRWAATGPFVSQQLAGGAGGARQAFINLGAALKSMWDDLGTVTLTPELEALVVSGAGECLAQKSQDQWMEERLRVVRAVQREKMILDGEDQSK
jgi:3-hydroxyacyl-CoA dehydrogenase